MTKQYYASKSVAGFDFTDSPLCCPPGTARRRPSTSPAPPHLLLLFLHLLGTGDGRVLPVRHVIARQLVPALICHILATLLDIETRIFNAGLLCLCAIRLYIDLEEDIAQDTAVICGS